MLSREQALAAAFLNVVDETKHDLKFTIIYAVDDDMRLARQAYNRLHDALYGR